MFVKWHSWQCQHVQIAWLLRDNSVSTVHINGWDRDNRLIKPPTASSQQDCNSFCNWHVIPSSQNYIVNQWLHGVVVWVLRIPRASQIPFRYYARSLNFPCIRHTFIRTVHVWHYPGLLFIGRSADRNIRGSGHKVFSCLIMVASLPFFSIGLIQGKFFSQRAVPLFYHWLCLWP